MNNLGGLQLTEIKPRGDKWSAKIQTIISNQVSGLDCDNLTLKGVKFKIEDGKLIFTKGDHQVHFAGSTVQALTSGGLKNVDKSNKQALTDVFGIE